MSIKLKKKIRSTNCIVTLFLFLFSVVISAQDITSVTVQSGNSAERFPEFSDCVNLQSKSLEICFYNQVQDFVFNNYLVSDNLKQINFKGVVKVLFEVNANGVFKVIYVDASQEDLILETKRVFGKFPKIQPATYNGKPTYAKFTMAIAIPLKSREVVAAENIVQAHFLPNKTKKLTELDSII